MCLNICPRFLTEDPNSPKPIGVVHESIKEGGATDGGYEVIPAMDQGRESIEGVTINTVTNEAYGVVMQQSGGPEAVYDVIDGPSESRSLPESANQNMYEMPSPSPHHQPLSLC